MSAATRATTARERAAIAADLIRRGRTQSRSFFSCFEMFDGDEVLRILRTKRSPAVQAYCEKVRGLWDSEKGAERIQ